MTDPALPLEVDLAPYEHLPWDELAPPELARAEVRQLVALVHAALTHGLDPTSSVADALAVVADRLPAVVAGVDVATAARIRADWLGRWRALLARPEPERRGWWATAAEATHGWWPADAPAVVRGVVQLVVRGGLVEHLHATTASGLLAAQAGPLALTWALATALHGRLDEALDGSVVEAPDGAAEDPFADAARFPDGLAAVVALGQAAAAGTTETPVPPVADPPEAIRAAESWLSTHVAAAEARVVAGRGSAVRRDGWTAPGLAELAVRPGGVAALDGLARISRHPAHLAAALQLLRARGVTVVAPGAAVGPTAVWRHHPGRFPARHPEHQRLLALAGLASG